MTVTVLAVSLFSVGFGAVPFLQQAFVDQVDLSVKQSASEATFEQLFLVEQNGSGGAGISARVPSDSPSVPFVALYKPDGTFLLHNGRPSATVTPAYPTAVTLDVASMQTDEFDMYSADGRSHQFRGTLTIVPVQIGETKTLFTMLVALPTAQIDNDIASYLTVFSMLAVIAIIGGGLVTRWLVTLAFRRLGQVESTAMAIAGGDFSQRMPGAESHTEVGRLKLAINTMLGRLDAAIGQRDATVSQMRRFVGDASHELRTPLVTVRGYAELYRMGAIRGEEDTAQAMDRIEKEAVRMGTLVEDLLALARLDERRELVFSPVDLRPIARDAAMDIRAAAPDRLGSFIDDSGRGPRPSALSSGAITVVEPTADAAAKRRTTPTTAIFQAGATLGRRLVRRRPGEGPTIDTVVNDVVSVDAPTAPEPIVLGQDDKIRQVVANLVGNARRYTPDDSPIEVAVGVDDAHEHGWIAVIDHGEGIPSQQRDRIFERFWRADTSRTRETGGSGLGLAIVASIVDSLHGSIRVEETPGGGATFRVMIPLAHVRTRDDHATIPTQPLTRLDLDDGPALPPSRP